jgi:putative DNA primase/helicase
VLPDAVIGSKASGVIFQSGERGHDEHTIGGTFADWQSDISARAVGNPLLMLAVSASFAGPMLARCNGESGGMHFVGDSSTGKTTAIEVACATWGGARFRRSWRATANGMEGAAALFNDCLLALDEISECDPKEVGAIIYALGNGRGKQRASRNGGARSVTRWRCFVLSSGC